jgi:hypothetical protein
MLNDKNYQRMKVFINKMKHIDYGQLLWLAFGREEVATCG